MHHKNNAYRRERVPPLWSPDNSVPALENPLSGCEFVRGNIIVAELDEISHDASLEELMTIIGPMTRDRGAVMRAIAAEELDEFADVASTAWRVREHGAESVLMDQQEHLHRQYTRWSARMEARAEQCRQLILQIIPEFDAQQYAQDPDYLKHLIYEKGGDQFDGRVKEWKQNNRDNLAYLRKNIEKLEAENDELRNQVSHIRERIKRQQQSQVAREQQLIDENENTEKKIKKIKERIGENTRNIDTLLLQLEKDARRSVVRRLDFHDEDDDDGPNVTENDPAADGNANTNPGPSTQQPQRQNENPFPTSENSFFTPTG